MEKSGNKADGPFHSPFLSPYISWDTYFMILWLWSIFQIDSIDPASSAFPRYFCSFRTFSVDMNLACYDVNSTWTSSFCAFILKNVSHAFTGKMLSLLYLFFTQNFIKLIINCIRKFIGHVYYQLEVYILMPVHFDTHLVITLKSFLSALHVIQYKKINRYHSLSLTDTYSIENGLELKYYLLLGFSRWLSDEQSACQAGDTGRSWGRKIPWRRKWKPTPVLFPGKSHEQRSLVGYSPEGHKS